MKGKILRLFKIWNERAIYDEVFLSDLCGLLTTNTKKSTTTESSEFQVISLKSHENGQANYIQATEVHSCWEMLIHRKGPTSAFSEIHV